MPVGIGLGKIDTSRPLIRPDFAVDWCGIGSRTVLPIGHGGSAYHPEESIGRAIEAAAQDIHTFRSVGVLV